MWDNSSQQINCCCQCRLLAGLGFDKISELQDGLLRPATVTGNGTREDSASVAAASLKTHSVIFRVL